MDETNAISKVREKLEQVQEQIALRKRQIADLEVEARRLTTTLSVLEHINDASALIDPSTVSVGVVQLSTSISDRLLATRFADYAANGVEPGSVVASLFNPTTRQLIVAAFAGGASLTRKQVLEQVKAADANANEGTVATTLSKLTKRGVLERVDGNAYRLKKVDPGAENTGDIDDLLKL